MNLEQLERFRQQLVAAKTVSEKNALLDALPSVQQAMRLRFFSTFLPKISLELQLVLKQVIEIQQGIDFAAQSEEKLSLVLQQLLEIDRFYREIGGIVGYQTEVMKLLQQERETSFTKLHSPTFEDISEETPNVLEAIRSGLEALPLMGEFYPLGGAADRLHLVDEKTGSELPAAMLRFAGRSLLETLIRDTQAREWLHYRLYGKEVITPVAIMTSREKDNHRHVLQICEDNGWFGRPKSAFRFFIQPSVPTVDEKGNWHTTGSNHLVLKPGGHGAIWKLAKDEGIFDWMQGSGRKKGLIRQINNPIAGLDYGLVAFLGFGALRDAQFGFSSCCRFVKAAEGMIVILEKNSGNIVLTNIEYCDFSKYGIEDEPLHPQGVYSRFNSNTNILFADLEAVERAVTQNPFPGLLMNLKSASIVDEKGNKREILQGRLESTMQNIADVFEEPKKEKASLETEKTFAVYNKRHKTISVAKKAFLPGKSSVETPEHCFYELLQANRELLQECGFSLPPSSSFEEYLQQGSNCLFLYHPALGPFYSIIRQKIRGGKLFGEWILEIAEIDAENVQVMGSLQILSERIVGEKNSFGILHSSHRVGRCVLRDVSVCNRGIDWNQTKDPIWKMNLHRLESVVIELKGCSEFNAQGIVLEGSHRFVVEDGKRMIVRQKREGEIIIQEEPLEIEPLWNYTWQQGVKIVSPCRNCK